MNMKIGNTLYTPKWYDLPIMSGLTVWAIFPRVEIHLCWYMHNSHLVPSSNEKVRGYMVLEHFLSEGSQPVPDETWPWSPLLYTLIHWPNGPGQQVCDAKRIYFCLDILEDLTPVRYCNKIKWFQFTKQGQEMVSGKTKVMNYWAFSSLAVIHLDIFIFQAVLQKIKDL